MITFRNRTTLLIATTALGGVLLSACGSDDTSNQSRPGASVAAHNDADVSFSTEMISHHRQAIEMAEMVLERGTSAEVKALAQRIKTAQDPEITQLSGFLTAFGEDVPTESDGMEHGSGHTGTGMMTETEMAQLEKASGAELEKMFLEMMIRHHEGAVEMASTELADGQYAQAKALAGKIKAAQATEITEMKTLLTKYA